MSNWWELQQACEGEPQPGVRAIAYYRHSAQDRQENSIPIQPDQVREWAAKNNVHIIHEFADAGKSGLNAEGRPAFTEMMDNPLQLDQEKAEDPDAAQPAGGVGQNPRVARRDRQRRRFPHRPGDSRETPPQVQF
ncbi:MAG: recombinase family protein [Planctomycetaceae bacterium]|nr:MAG: recombinase family protein [Planctomycetaceae bacterium]